MLESSCILSSGSLDAKKIAGLLTQCWYNPHTKLAVVLNCIELYIFVLSLMWFGVIATFENQRTSTIQSNWSGENMLYTGTVLHKSRVE